MKSVLAFSLIVVALCQLSSAVTVTEGDYRFSLESVKQLGELMNNADTQLSLRLVEDRAQAVCANPALPKEFQPLCQSRNAGVSLARLALVATRAGPCELCQFVACTGC